MDDIKKEELRALLEQEKYHEAQQILDDYFSEELSEIERGEAYTQAVMEYLAMANEVNTRYLAALDEKIEEIKELETIKEEYSNKIDTSVVRNQINES